MLRSLEVSKDNPNGVPKSAKFHPTEAEKKNYSPEELAYIEKTTEEDREFRANRAERALRTENLLRVDDNINESKKGSK